MEAHDLLLIGLVAVLATALARMLFARLRDLRTLRERAGASDALAKERAERRRLETQLLDARARIGKLEDGLGAGRRELEPAGRFSRR